MFNTVHFVTGRASFI